jgi:hypothetical protein
LKLLIYIQNEKTIEKYKSKFNNEIKNNGIQYCSELLTQQFKYEQNEDAYLKMISDLLFEIKKKIETYGQFSFIGEIKEDFMITIKKYFYSVITEKDEEINSILSLGNSFLDNNIDELIIDIDIRTKLKQFYDIINLKDIILYLENLQYKVYDINPKLKKIEDKFIRTIGIFIIDKYITKLNEVINEFSNKKINFEIKNIEKKLKLYLEKKILIASFRISNQVFENEYDIYKNKSIESYLDYILEIIIQEYPIKIEQDSELLKQIKLLNNNFASQINLICKFIFNMTNNYLKSFVIQQKLINIIGILND